MASINQAIKVLIGKVGLDGHDRGAKLVARFFKEAEMKVVYTGIRNTPEMIASKAASEGVDVIGLSSLTGSHLELFPKVIDELEKRGVNLEETLLIAGGIIPDRDIPKLKELGFSGIFGPGSSINDIIQFVEDWVQTKRSTKAFS